MEILNKENLRKAIESPLGFVVIILLIILALSQSFALWCLIGGLVAISVAILGKDINSTTSFFCSDFSWKIKLTHFFTKLLGDYILAIIVLSLIAWWFFNHTNKGQDLLSLLD